MKPKTLHFRLTSISRNKERPDNAVKACAYRSGFDLVDRKTGEVHRYARRGGVVRIGLFASGTAPEWTQDDNQKRLWERFGNEIETVEDSHNRRAAALLAKDLHGCFCTTPASVKSSFTAIKHKNLQCRATVGIEYTLTRRRNTAPKVSE